MVSTFTPNIQLEEPARGDYVGTWDTPVNNNMTLIDLVAGGRTTISGAAGSVVLAAAQYQCKTITFNSTLLASIVVTFPTSFTKSYEVYHTCTGSSAFTITLQTTAGGNVIAIPPGDICEVFTDGTNMRFKNFGRVGSYWDYAGSSVPNWVSACSIPPYLNCDGSTFSATTYPVLASILGSTTLPDSKGRFRAALDQSAGRLSSAVTGFSPNTVGAAGSSQTVTVAQSNLPNVNFAVSGGINVLVSGTAAGGIVNFGVSTPVSAVGGGAVAVYNSASYGQIAATFSSAVAASGGTGTALPVVPPTYIGGLTLIRGA